MQGPHTRVPQDRALVGRREGDGVPEEKECADHVRPPSRMEEGDRQGQDALARGYCVSAVGINESVIKSYVREQEDASRIAD